VRSLFSVVTLVALVSAQLLAPLAAMAWPSDTSASVPLTPSVTANGPYAAVHRIIVIVMENHSYSAIVNSRSTPYLNSLIKRYGLATNYTGVAHPSEPNYLALFSGSGQGVVDDGVHTFSGRNLADQLEAHGRTWRVVAENVPLGCYRGATFYGGPDGPGWYARKHEPAIMFRDISADPTRCPMITDLRHFSLTAADFQLVVPNMCHDMHDCSIATGDAFLGRFVGTITASRAFANTLVVVTFDEGTDSYGGGGRIPTILLGPMVRPGARSSVAHNHYSLLRTIQNAWALGCLNRSCAANDLREFFGT
jgi:hypothetical protein